MRIRITSVAMSTWMVLAATACAQHEHQYHEQQVISPRSIAKPDVPNPETAKVGPQGGQLQQLERMQVETIVAPSGLRLFAYNQQGQLLDLRNVKGLAVLTAEGDTKSYRYDLFPEIAKDNSADSLAVAVDLARMGGRNVELAYQLLGLPGADRRPTKFTAKLTVSMTESQRVAAAIESQRTCPVSGLPLGKMGKPIAVTIGEETVYVCCAGCIDAVKSDPPKYLAGKPQLVVAVATAADAAAIAQQKLCPVMDEPLDAMGGPYKTVVDGRVVYLCCPGCAKKLHATPTEFLKKLADQGISPPLVR